MHKAARPMRPRPTQSHDDCDCGGLACRILLTLVCAALFLLCTFALYSAFYGARDANDYYGECVRVTTERQAGPKCAGSIKVDCAFAPRRSCAMSTLGFIIGSIFLWVLYVLLLPVLAPFAVYDWIAAAAAAAAS
ncbi:hypothetical protein psal_cds_1255 [Pandoravirus salinus]|uniref:Uncharacterized protein n=1 Tax=Pandoravirus salinus TaxID=1349410 RepID=S4W1C1_9VIRU|nr:hypothetical protein psal_cds_1255 [Pandoravirus salinus]AGO85591.1 hypothetical protein psal_cds_1255 [Pandoravirus salinus]